MCPICVGINPGSILDAGIFHDVLHSLHKGEETSVAGLWFFLNVIESGVTFESLFSMVPRTYCNAGKNLQCMTSLNALSIEEELKESGLIWKIFISLNQNDQGQKSLVVIRGLLLKKI